LRNFEKFFKHGEDESEEVRVMMRLSRSPSLVVWLLWHSAAVVAITLIPSELRLARAVWSLPTPDLAFLIGIAATYLVAIFILTFWTRRERTVSLLELVGIVTAVAIS